MSHPYAAETRSFLNRLLEAGFTLVNVFYDDDDDNIAVNTVDDAVEELTATDESFLVATNPEGNRVSVMFVYGNAPGELIANYSCDPLLDKAVDQHYDQYN